MGGARREVLVFLGDLGLVELVIQLWRTQRMAAVLVGGLQVVQLDLFGDLLEVDDRPRRLLRAFLRLVWSLRLGHRTLAGAAD